MRYKLAIKFLLVSLLSCAVLPAQAGVSVSIGINLPLYPDLVPVPGYPVYYAPELQTNYFFYDGLYWVYSDDNWYQSAWYNGPWELIDPVDVPYYVLRIPVRYYRRPPVYFRGWSANQPPRWGDHWGNDWSQRRSGWNHWNHSAAPARAPLPTYQRRYSGNQYPQPDQQQTLEKKNYRYQPHHSPLPQQPATPRPAPQRQQPPNMSNAPQSTRPAVPMPQQNNNNRHTVNERANETHEVQQHRPASPHVTPPPAAPHPMPNSNLRQAPRSEEHSRQTPNEPHPQPRPEPRQPVQQPHQPAPEMHSHEERQRDHRETPPGN